MPDDDQRPHFRISTDQVREEALVIQPGGGSYEREDYAAHGRRLLQQVEKAVSVVVRKRDAALTRDLILQVETPDDIPIRTFRQKLEGQGMELISYSARAQNAA